MVARIRPSIVRVASTSSSGSGTGTGLIFETTTSEQSALVLTNHHVIEDATSIKVTVNDSATYSASIVGAEPLRDLAVLKICCSRDFQRIPFGDASKISAGAEVLVIGYALGLSGPASVTKGIVSATRFESDAKRWVIQTDAAINSGNSGGPLVTLTGEVIGINTFVIRRVSSAAPVEGFGFSISEVTVREILPSLKSGALAIAPIAPKSYYENSTYWYTVTIPSGWSVDSTKDDAITTWDSSTGATIGVVAKVINPSLYPTLDSYVSSWQPAPSEGWTEFEITSRYRIRTDSTVQAHEFRYKFTSKGAAYNSVANWYILGRFFVSVSAVWPVNLPHETRLALDRVLETFDPGHYFPLHWKSGGGYYYDPYGSTTVYQYTYSALGYTSIQSYGAAHTVLNAAILSRQLVYTGRPNRAYRIDYTRTYEGKQIRGAVLITLSGSNAIWVFVDDWAENWSTIETLVDDIFLRVAVKP